MGDITHTKVCCYLLLVVVYVNSVLMVVLHQGEDVAEIGETNIIAWIEDVSIPTCCVIN